MKEENKMKLYKGNSRKENQMLRQSSWQEEAAHVIYEVYPDHDLSDWRY
jgi:hypothetical protein